MADFHRPQPSRRANGAAADTPSAHSHRPARSTKHPGRSGSPSTQGQARLPADGQRPGPAVAGYDLLAEIGRGTMGVVYRATQLSLHRLVALKMIRSGSAAWPEELERFLDEARIIARLHHPHIVQIHEIGQQQDVPYFAMEYVDGGSLAEALAGRPQPADHAARFIQVLARAIHRAHQLGIVHRDLKPANILLASVGSSDGSAPTEETTPVDLARWTPKITDFGLAKQLDRVGSHTQSGMILGTPNYMAPEQAAGRTREVGPAADIYALGAILYELLTGRPPHNATTPAETILLLFQAEPLAPSRVQARIPRDLETICLKCLQKDQRQRYATADELADDLGRFLEGRPIQARPAPLLERTWKWGRRHPTLATLLAGSLVVVAGLVVFGFWHEIDLRRRLDRALTDEQQARAAQEEASTRVRLARAHAHVLDLVHAGEQALSRADWDAAHLELTRAHESAASTPGLDEIRARTELLLARVDRQRADRRQYQEFLRLYDEALLHASLFTGDSLASALQATRSAAQQALELLAAAPMDSPYLEPGEKQRLASGRAEMLLVLADAMAHPLPGQGEREKRQAAAAALAVLDQRPAEGILARAFHLRRAAYLAQAGEVAAAAREAERSRALAATGALDYFMEAQEHYRRQDWGQAAALFERVLQQRPDHFWARYYLALTALQDHRPDLAVTSLTACLGDRPNFPWLYLLRGAAQGAAGRFAYAEEDFARATALPLDDPARYGLLIHRGVLRVRRERLDEAIRDLQQAVALRPGLYHGHLNLGQAYMKANNADQALAQLDEAVRCEPSLPVVYRTRAHVLLQYRDEEAALADLERAINLEPDPTAPTLPDCHVERGRILYHRGDLVAALEACTAALCLRPDHTAAHRLRAEVLLELGQLPEALAALDACTNGLSAPADVLRARGAVRARMGRYAEALADYSRALSLAPSAELYGERGWVYAVTDAPRLALADFDAAVRLEPARGEGYAGRSFALLKLGRLREALSDSEVALRRGPQTSRLVYTAARVQALAVTVGRRPRERSVVCADRAVQLLRQALDLIPYDERARFWTEIVQVDAALANVRGRPEFVQLAEQYGRARGARLGTAAEVKP